MAELSLPGQVRRKGPLFYGWIVVIAAFIANFMGSGLGFYIFNAFIEPLCRLRGWTRTDINLGPMLGYIAGIVAALFYGSIVNRAGARALMTISSLVTAVSFYLLGTSVDLPLFYIFFILMMTGIGGMNGIVSTTVVNHWFIAKRGMAMGIATAAISLSGVILTPLAMLVMDRFGLESAFLWISLGIALVAPLAWLMVRNRPEERGLHPDGAGEGHGTMDTGARPEQDIQPVGHWTLTMSLRSGNFWKIGVAYGLSMASVLGVMYQLKPRFSDLGFDGRTAMGLMAGTALAGAAGKYWWAYLCDRYKAKNVSAALMTCNAIGLFIMLGVNSMASAVIFVLVYGFAMGGVVSTQPVIIAEYFGRNAYASIARYVYVLVGIDFIGYPIMGRCFDLTGSYNTAYGAFVLFNLSAALLVFILKKN